MDKTVLKYHSTDNGNCRVYFKSGKLLYCFQLESEYPVTFDFLICSKDGEPSHPANQGAFNVELPKNEELVSRQLIKWLKG